MIVEKDTKRGFLPGLEHIERCSQLIDEVPVLEFVANASHVCDHCCHWWTV